jgi:hypothetical protein
LATIHKPDQTLASVTSVTREADLRGHFARTMT